MVTKQDVMKVENGRLIIDVAIDPKGTLSASGKSNVNFSTRGNIKLNEGKFNLGVNLYSKS